MSIAACALSTPIATADTDDSQAQPAVCFSVHKEQRPVTDALEDFERFRDKKAWEKAFTAIARIDAAKPGRLVPDKDGFLIPTELKVRAEFLSLPPEGRQAYRLFNDAKAAQLFKDATATPANEIPSLWKIVNRYFVTSIGDQAADRLGDALFESGDFSNAQYCWSMILDNFPDTSLSPLLLQTKRAIALARSNEWDEFNAVNASIHQRYAGQSVHLGGTDVIATDLLDSLQNPGSPTIASGAGDETALSSFATSPLPNSPTGLPTSDEPIWQIPLMDGQASAQLITQLGQTGWGQMAGQFTSAMPATAVDEKHIFINWLGICFAADMHTGKLLWRTDTFGDMTQKMSQSMMYGTVIDPQIYTVTQAGDKVIFTRRSTDNQNYNELPMTRLLCLNSETGKAIWKSETNSLSAWGMLGRPILQGDHFYIVAHATGSQETSLLCIGIEKGDIKWTVPLGTPASSTNYRGMPSIPQPTLARQGGMIQVLTNNGVLLQVNTGSHQVEWAFNYPTYVAGQQMYYGNYVPPPVVAPGAILSIGQTIYFKEFNNSLLFALDPTVPALKWKRRIDADNSIANYFRNSLLMVGNEIECVDTNSRALVWDDKTSIRTGSIQPMLQGDWLYVFGSRGVTSHRISTGESGPLFRGYDRDSDGGTLWKTTNRLITVSSRAITAYPIKNQ